MSKYNIEIRNRGNKEWEIKETIDADSRRQVMSDPEVKNLKTSRQQFRVRRV